MAGENDQDQDDLTPEDGSGSSETDDEREAREAWAEFSGATPEGDDADDDDDADDPDDDLDASAETDDQSSEPSEEDETSDAGEENGESSAEANDGDADAGDIWAEAPSELQSAFAAEKARADRLEHEARSNRGRVAALEGRLDSLIGGTEQKAGAGRKTPSESDFGPDKVFGTDEWKTMREEFADIAEPIEKSLAPVFDELAKVQAENRKLSNGMQTIGQDRTRTRAIALEDEVRAEHADYDDIINSDDFASWLQASPTYIQEGVQRNGKMIVDPAEAIDIFNRFKADTGFGAKAEEDDSRSANAKSGKGKDSSKQTAPSRRRQIQLNSATAPRSKAGDAVVQDKDPQTETEMWHWAKKKIKAQREEAVI